MKLGYTIIQTQGGVYWTLCIMPDNVSWSAMCGTTEHARCIMAHLARGWHKAKRNAPHA